MMGNSHKNQVSSTNKDIAKLLLLVAPLAIIALLSLVIAFDHQIALRKSGCSLMLPWNFSAAQDIIKRINPAAGVEAEKIAAISGQCIAGLHILAASAYTVMLIICVASTSLIALSLSFQKEYIASTTNIRRFFRSIMMVAMGLLLLYAVKYYLYDMGLIEFIGERRRFMIRFVGPYINPFNYWKVFMSLILVGSVGATFLICGIKLLAVNARVR